jgi:enamine deaminase RidA (YjgF/YER057c/UK114 family)
VPEPAGAYIAAARAGTLIFTAGELHKTGKVGDAVTSEAASEAARLSALNALAAAEPGGLDRIARVVKVSGFVASAPGFKRQPEVVNGASELIGKVFGEVGPHARSAVGVAQLPLNAPVEVDLIAELNVP